MVLPQMRHLMHLRLQGFLHRITSKELRVHGDFVGRALIADKALVGKVPHAIAGSLQGDEALRQLRVE